MTRAGGRWLAVTACGFLLTIAFVLSDAPARWLVLEDPAQLVDAAVVLAGDPDYERTAMAVSIVRSGQARLLVLTGAEWIGPGDSASSLRERAIELGLSPDRIYTEGQSTSTREAVLALAPILEKLEVSTVALVTSPYHQRRAFLAASRAWPDVTIRNRPASPSFWSPHGWWRSPRPRRVVVTEYAKLFLYAVRGWI